eukprot:634979-Rhodomonas_salina.1
MGSGSSSKLLMHSTLHHSPNETPPSGPSCGIRLAPAQRPPHHRAALCAVKQREREQRAVRYLCRSVGRHQDSRVLVRQGWGREAERLGRKRRGGGETRQQGPCMTGDCRRFLHPHPTRFFRGSKEAHEL